MHKFSLYAGIWQFPIWSCPWCWIWFDFHSRLKTGRRKCASVKSLKRELQQDCRSQTDQNQCSRTRDIDCFSSTWSLFLICRREVFRSIWRWLKWSLVEDLPDCLYFFLYAVYNLKTNGMEIPFKKHGVKLLCLGFKYIILLCNQLVGNFPHTEVQTKSLAPVKRRGGEK